MTRSAGDRAYTPPRIRDHGSLADLTADFDLNFVGSVAKTLTIAAASAPMPGGGDPPDGGTSMNPPPGGETPGGEVPGIQDPGADLPDPPDDGRTGGEREDDPGGAVRTETESSGIPTEGGAPGEGPGGSEGAGGTLPASEAGRLPFTGYVAWSWAAAGATMTTAGIAMRRMLRRGG
jgi:hypothetical protein